MSFQDFHPIKEGERYEFAGDVEAALMRVCCAHCTMVVFRNMATSGFYIEKRSKSWIWMRTKGPLSETWVHGLRPSEQPNLNE